MSLFPLAQQVTKIARQAGQAILEIYHQDDFGVKLKSDDSPLTAADKAANAIICAGLEQLDVQYPIISEENKQVDFNTRKNYTRCWMVDPLDGTKEFIKRNGEFTVNIALIESGKVILGVVYVPVDDAMYFAAQNEGAYRIAHGERTLLQAPTFSADDKGLGLVCSRSHLNEETQAFVDEFDMPELVAKGSSLKFLVLAEGGAHVYPRLAPTMEWDTAAAQIILEEAGGLVVHADTQQPLTYNKENLLNPYFIACANRQS